MGKSTSAWIAATAALCLLTACGEEEQRAGSRGAAGGATTATKPTEKAGSGAKAGAAADDALANVPEKLRGVDWNAKDDLELRDARDPFKYFLDDVLPRAADAKAVVDSPCRGPLCEEDAGGLKLMAIITGTSVHKAMMLDAKNIGHVVRAGDVIGKEPYRVTRITRNEVVLKPLQPPAPGQPPAQEIVKKLLGDQELQELLP